MNAAGESEVDSDSDEDLIKSLEADFQLEDKCQDKINPQLATAINNVWKLKLSKEKIKERLDKHYRPENCEQLIMTKVNPELFLILPKHARSIDIKFQKLQTYNLKAAMPVAKQLDALKELKQGLIITKEQLRKLQSLATDTLVMMSCTNSKILQVRRDNLGPQLSSNYRQLKNEVPEGSKLLFGDDLSKRLTSIKATNKASKGVFNQQPEK